MAKNHWEKTLTARTTKRPQNWYLRGWELREVDGRKKLVYTREYYKLTEPEKRARRKALAVGLYLLLCAVYIGFETTMAQGGLVWYAGAPCLLAVIPLFYLGLGVYNFAAMERYFTYRRMYAAYTRLRIGGKGTAILLALGFAGQLVFVLIYGRALDLRPELIMLFGALIGAACAAGLVILQKNTRFEDVSPREYPGGYGEKRE